MMSLPSSEEEWLTLIARGELVKTYDQNERIEKALRAAGLDATPENVRRVIELSRGLMYPKPTAQKPAFAGSLEEIDNQLA